MNHVNIVSMLSRLSHPSVIISLVSQVVQILVLVGVDVNQKAILSIVTTLCSIFVTLGVLSNPDTENPGYGDDFLICARSGELEKHMKVAGQMVCQPHGRVYKPPEASLDDPAAGALQDPKEEEALVSTENEAL